MASHFLKVTNILTTEITINSFNVDECVQYPGKML